MSLSFHFHQLEILFLNVCDDTLDRSCWALTHATVEITNSLLGAHLLLDLRCFMNAAIIHEENGFLLPVWFSLGYSLIHLAMECCKQLAGFVAGENLVPDFSLI
jgi:hypothetical protein